MIFSLLFLFSIIITTEKYYFGKQVSLYLQLVSGGDTYLQKKISLENLSLINMKVKIWQYRIQLEGQPIQNRKIYVKIVHL